MRPILFEFFGFKVHSFGVMLVIGFILGLMLAKKRAEKFGVEPGKVYDAAIWTLLPGVLGARLFFVVQEWSYYSKHIVEIFTKFEGLTSFGGIAFGVVGLLVWCRIAKKQALLMLDLLAPSFLVSHAVGRIGCLLNGCCYGGACDLPWAVHVGDQPGLFHPAQVYDGLLNIGALLLFFAIEKRGLGRGGSIGWILILHGIARFIYEFWRAGTTSTYMGSLPITDAQAMALLVSAIGLIFVLRARKTAVSHNTN